MTKEEYEKQCKKLDTTIGQVINAPVITETLLTEADFEAACDAAGDLMTYLRKAKRQLNYLRRNPEDEEK